MIEAAPQRATPGLRKRRWPAPRIGLAVAALVAAAAGAAAWRSETPLSALPHGPVLDRAVARGVLRVGVRSYPRPAPPEAPTPPEPDSFDATLAARLAASLGVRLELVGLASEAQTAALRQGEVDVLFAGVPESGAPEGVAIAPGNYSPGRGMVVALRKGRIQDTTALRGATVCAGEGSSYARTVSSRYGAVPKRYPSGVHAVSAFMAGECAALVEDAEVLDRLLQDGQWRFYRPLVSALDAADGAGVRLPEGDAASRDYLSAALRRWESDGTLDRARIARGGNLRLEIAQLRDGLVCHS
ncbi:transporter substrate-binding domain-containing protein [Variovorax sp. J22R115]|uniref:transporter substrate-binding domain-containing protein n=1 Tax=Variovorax sp. J22R115 TaxID=3053509 RepID=UPI0025755BFA|nr:transporter substrate-binding domain-containing protein [Variovorax sp. J22R115]MDM0047691.1 transporter substrate-binding domain-containing protein [Variovorax sp. J22R115]